MNLWNNIYSSIKTVIYMALKRLDNVSLVKQPKNSKIISKIQKEISFLPNALNLVKKVGDFSEDNGNKTASR